MRILMALVVSLMAAQLHAAELDLYQGEPLPDFTLTDLGGKSHTLSKLRGKVVVVNFWATYCRPCIREMPSLQRLKEKMKGRPFELLAINMAEERAAIDAFLKQNKIKNNFPILLDPQGEVIEAWMIGALPATFIVDTKGVIRYSLYGGYEWDNDEVVTTINALLKQN